MFSFTQAERERRWKNIRKAMRKQGLECLIVWGSSAFVRNVGANLRYLTNIMTDGYLLFPLEEEPTLFTFLKMLDATSWVPDRRSGHPKYSEVMSERIKELHLESARIGLVGLSGYCGEIGFPHTTYVSLTSNLPRASFEDATDILEEATRIKSDEEIRCLELGCEVGEKVVQAIVDTAKVGVTDHTIRAKITETLSRNGCEPGSLLLYNSGKEVQHANQGGYLQSPVPRALEHGDIILTEFNTSYLGYNAQFNQPFSVGEPNELWREMFSVAVAAFNNAFQTLRPGITLGELDEAFLSPIKEAGYTYLKPPFHGLGLNGVQEPIGSFPDQPTYQPNTALRIEPGFVIEFEPHVVTSDEKKGIHLGSPVLVTETGCRLLSKTWKPEFKIV